ncbi:MAG: hypothetical protein HON65_16645 [Rhodospirillales bacterium]|jgi:hypothetical protein|nr:hypothetical protein [Rhodospirillales bacterium]
MKHHRDEHFEEGLKTEIPQQDTITVLTTVTNKGDQRKLAKTFHLLDGQPKERETPRPKYYTHSQKMASGIRDFANQITPLFGDSQSCIIRGELVDPTKSHGNITRTKEDDLRSGKIMYFQENETGKYWVCFDFDKIKNPDRNLTEEEMLRYLVSKLGPEFEKITFLYHWSSSAGLDGWKTISAHLYFWLSEPRTDAEMKDWAVDLNNNAGTKIVDDTLFDCIQAHYTANPIFEDGLTDPVQTGRAGLIEGEQESVSIPVVAMPNTAPSKRKKKSTKSRPENITSVRSDFTGSNEATLEEILEPLDAIRRVKQPYSMGWRNEWRDMWFGIANISGTEEATKLLNQSKYFPEQEPGEYAELASSFVPKKSGFHRLDQIASRLDPMYQSSRSHLATGTAISSYRLTNKINSGQLFKYLSAGCGEGKSYQMLADIALLQKGIWMYSVEKITSIDERIKELKKYCHKHGLEEPTIRKAHREMYKEDPSKKKIPVGKQIGLIKDDLESQGIEFCIVFVTHRALFMRKWSAWIGSKIVIDEAPEVFRSGQLHLNYNLSREFVEDHFEKPEIKDGDCYELNLNEVGEQALTSLFKAEKTDPLAKILEDMLEASKQKNGKLYVKAQEWNDQDSLEISWFGFVDPRFLAPFDEVWMLGDALEETEVFKLWRDRFMVQWEQHQISRPRQWKVPICDRTKVKYYEPHREASLTRFNDPEEEVLNKVETHLFANKTTIGYWTTNESIRLKGLKLQGEYIEPKAHGRNDLMHHKSGAYFAAIQPSGFEKGLVKQVFGMTPDELVIARHRRPVLQHTMRGVLRDPESKEFFEQHVYSKVDALYLQARFNCEIEHVEGVIESEPYKPGVKPDLGVKMSQEERNDKRQLKIKGLTEEQSIEAILKMRFENYSRDQAELHFAVVNKFRRMARSRVSQS